MCLLFCKFEKNLKRPVQSVGMKIFCVVLLVFNFVKSAIINDRAFVSTLYSNDFLLATQVLAHNLKSFHPDFPYLILYTGDVSNETLTVLENHPNVLLQNVKKIQTPQYATHHAKKFQYTKIHLWSLTDYKSIVFLDLDTILVDKIDELFDCGRFCASLRHSDAFNTGVMVIKPDKNIYNDMLNKTLALESYDGGDQGFLNSYFWEVKNAKMFNANETREKNGVQRISAAYNFDVGIYYLSSRMLVAPKIIHFTLAFVKPWDWYGYPLFDLNWHWFANRLEMHHKFNESLTLDPCSIFQNIFTFFILLSVYQLTSILCKSQNKRPKKVFTIERQFASICVFGISLLMALKLTPMELLPHLGWSLFTINFSLSLGILASIYSQIRFNSSNLFLNCISFLLLISVIHLIGWHLLIWIKVPGKRIITTVCILVFYASIVYYTLILLIFTQTKSKCRWSYGKEGRSEEMEQLSPL